METARESTVVSLPVEDAHGRWLEFTGESASGSAAGSGTSEQVPDDKLPDEVEKGKVFFDAEGDGSTRVTMELRYNPAVVKEAGLSEDWVARRIGLYLQRFKDQAER
jgi:hypothetical protein